MTRRLFMAALAAAPAAPAVQEVIPSYSFVYVGDELVHHGPDQYENIVVDLPAEVDRPLAEIEQKAARVLGMMGAAHALGLEVTQEDIQNAWDEDEGG